MPMLQSLQTGQLTNRACKLLAASLQPRGCTDDQVEHFEANLDAMHAIYLVVNPF